MSNPRTTINILGSQVPKNPDDRSIFVIGQKLGGTATSGALVENITSKEQSIRIEASSGLTDDDIEKMKRDAEKHAKEDKEKREEIDLRNNADQIIYQTEKSLEEAGDNIDTALKEKITKHLDDLKAAKESNDNAKLKEALDTLNQEWAKLSQEMYSQAPPPNQEESSTNTKK